VKPNIARGIPITAPINVKHKTTPKIIITRPNNTANKRPIILKINPIKFHTATNGQKIIHVSLYLILILLDTFYSFNYIV